MLLLLRSLNYVGVVLYWSGDEFELSSIYKVLQVNILCDQWRWLYFDAQSTFEYRYECCICCRSCCPCFVHGACLVSVAALVAFSVHFRSWVFGRTIFWPTNISCLFYRMIIFYTQWIYIYIPSNFGDSLGLVSFSNL